LSWSSIARRAWFRAAVKVATVPALLWLGFLIVTGAVYQRLLYQQAGLTWAALATSVVITQCLIAPLHPVRGFLPWRPMTQIARMSSGLYLWPSPVAWPTDPRTPDVMPILPRPVLFTARVCLTFATAGLSYRFLELPLLRLKPRLSPAELHLP